MVEFIRGMSSARTVNKSSVSSSYTLSSSVSLSPSSFLALFVIYYINIHYTPVTDHYTF